MNAEAGAYAEGSSIGRYRIEGLIGSGGMGAVYRAVDPFLRRVVALKVLSAPREDENAQERFFREARAIARLEHRNIVRIYEADAPQGTPYIAMEYLEGQDGREFVRSRPSLTRAIDVTVQVFEGLACAHGLGVIHRDVKPGNMIVLPGDVVKLIDFGLARLADDKRDLTRGQVFGSAPFMAPEQITSPGRIDARTDIYSAGVILYCLLTGTLPFKGATVAETLVQIVHGPPPEIEALRPDCPPDLAALIQRCIAKDPADRPSSAREVAEALRRISHRLSRPRITLPPPPPPLPPPPGLAVTGPVAAASEPPETSGAADALTQYDLLGPAEPEAPLPLAAPARPAGPSVRPVALALATAGLVVSIGAGTAYWLRRPPAPSPTSGGTPYLLPPLPASPATGAAAADGPRLVVDDPALRAPRIRARGGEKLLMRVRVDGAGTSTAEPQWRLNDELVAIGPSWTYKVGPGKRVDLVSVSLPDVEVSARTIVIWHVIVE